MKVKCIMIRWYYALTIGKTYNVIGINKYNNYIIINDNGIRGYYPKEWFKLLSELRNETIDKLLADES